MKYLNGEKYVEAKNHRYKIPPTEKITLRKPDEPKSLRGRNQKVIKHNNDDLIGKNYPKNKKQPVVQQQLSNSPVVREIIG